MTRARVSLVVAAIVAATGAAVAQPADVIYTNGAILTMAGEAPRYVDTLAVRGEKIGAAGTKADQGGWGEVAWAWRPRLESLRATASTPWRRPTWP